MRRRVKRIVILGVAAVCALAMVVYLVGTRPYAAGDHRAGAGRPRRLVRRHQPAHRRRAAPRYDAACALGSRYVHARVELGLASGDDHCGSPRRDGDKVGCHRGDPPV